MQISKEQDSLRGSYMEYTVTCLCYKTPKMASLFTCHGNSSTFDFRRVLGNNVWLKFGEDCRWITLSSIHTLPEMYICLEIIPFPQTYGLIMAKTFSKQVGFSLSPFKLLSSFKQISGEQDCLRGSYMEYTAQLSNDVK